MSKPTLVAVTGGEDEASVTDKRPDHLEHVLIRKKSEQLEATVADGVDKQCTSLLHSLK